MEASGRRKSAPPGPSATRAWFATRPGTAGMFIASQGMVKSSWKFEKTGVLDCYLSQRAYLEMLIERGVSLRSVGAFEPLLPSKPRSDLLEISLREMRKRLNNVYEGRVLFGTFCVHPFRHSSLMTVLEDAGGRAIAVTVFHVDEAAASADKFRLGQKVAIEAPVIQQAYDGRYCLYVCNPDDIKVVVDHESSPSQANPGTTSRTSSSWKLSKTPGKHRNCDVCRVSGAIADRWKSNCNSLRGCSSAVARQSSETPADSLRIQGNHFFAMGDWENAIEFYTRSLAAVYRDDKDYAEYEKAMLCFSNRAETWLRLGNFNSALADSLKAVELKPTHEKSLLRMGKAMYGLQRYTECVDCLELLLSNPQVPGVAWQSEEVEALLLKAKAALKKNNKLSSVKSATDHVED